MPEGNLFDGIGEMLFLINIPLELEKGKLIELVLLLELVRLT